MNQMKVNQSSGLAKSKHRFECLLKCMLRAETDSCSSLINIKFSGIETVLTWRITDVWKKNSYLVIVSNLCSFY